MLKSGSETEYRFVSPRSLLYVVLRVDVCLFNPSLLLLLLGSSNRTDEVTDVVVCGGEGVGVGVVGGMICEICGLTASAFIHMEGMLLDGSLGGWRAGTVDEL